MPEKPVAMRVCRLICNKLFSGRSFVANLLQNMADSGADSRYIMQRHNGKNLDIMRLFGVWRNAPKQ